MLQKSEESSETTQTTTKALLYLRAICYQSKTWGNSTPSTKPVTH